MPLMRAMLLKDNPSKECFLLSALHTEVLHMQSLAILPFCLDIWQTSGSASPATSEQHQRIHQCARGGFSLPTFFNLMHVID